MTKTYYTDGMNLNGTVKVMIYMETYVHDSPKLLGLFIHLLYKKSYWRGTDIPSACTTQNDDHESQWLILQSASFLLPLLQWNDSHNEAQNNVAISIS